MTVGKGMASRFNRRVTIERPIADASFEGAGSGTWEPVAIVAAEVQDDLPSRSERQADGAVSSTRRARVRMRYRTDVTSNMRLVMGGRAMSIVSGPVEFGVREQIEMLVEDYSPAGNSA